MSEIFNNIKKGLQEKADLAINRISSFLDKNCCYSLTLETDPFGSGRVWFIQLSKDCSRLVIAFISDGSKVSAEQIRKHIAMMLLVMGFSIQSSPNEEFVYSQEDFDKMKKLEKFFAKTDIHVTYEINLKTKFSSIICESGEEKITLVEVGGLSETSISILSKQVALILGGLGKHFSTKDKTVGNRYGIVEFCPSEDPSPIKEAVDDGWL